MSRIHSRSQHLSPISTAFYTRPRAASNYAGNDGIIEGVWMFTRHGDRTPSRPLMPNHKRQEESAYWVSRLPAPSSWAVFCHFSAYFPVEGNQSFLELKRNPYGFLTEKGVQQLNEHGKRFRARYLKHGLHDYELGGSFEDIWDVQAYSTNYLRTVLSVQSFLSGIFDVPQSCQTRRTDPNLYLEHWPASEMDCTGNAGSDLVSNISPLTSVVIRDVQQDPLNAFDRNPDLMDRLSTEVMSSETFRCHDGKAAPLAARLASMLPGLVKNRSSDYAVKSPSGINWVEAADHFVCRDAHQVPLAKFSDLEEDERMEETLKAMSHPTLAHLSWRFRQWYQNQALLAAVAAPPLREILGQIETTAANSTNSYGLRPLVVYSCHDITILGILYAIKAKILEDDERFWPPYGSHLAFELVKRKNCTRAIRILLNGRSLRSLHVEAEPSKDDEGTLSLVAAERIVSSLELAGGNFR